MEESVLTVNNMKYAVTEAELHLPSEEGLRMMYMSVRCGPNTGFALWEYELALLANIEDLHAKRIHVTHTGEAYADDTLGTDIVGAHLYTDANVCCVEGDVYVYGDILVDFKRVEGRKYRCHAELALSDLDQYPADLSPEDFKFAAIADITVIADEKHLLEKLGD